MTSPRVLIVGGGIGGLTTAIALGRVGLRPTLVERTPEFGTVGAGITIQANAMAILDALQADLPTEDVHPIGPFKMVDPRGQVIMDGDPSRVPIATPSINIHRADLHRALMAACDPDSVHLGRALTGLNVSDDGVDVTFSDGTEGRWDAVVGADGASSTVRRLLLGEAACALRYAGQTCWRMAAPAREGVPIVTIERWTPGRRIGLVPLSRDRVYSYMVESAPEGTPGPQSATPAALREHFAGVDERLDALLETLGEDIPIHHGDLAEQPLIHFGRGRVVLLGDAAHAMTPNMGQGAGTSIEDAAALALLIAAGTPLDQLPRALHGRRYARVRDVQKMSWHIGQIAHWTNPVACWIRNLGFRAMPASVSDAQAQKLWQPGLELAAELNALRAR